LTKAISHCLEKVIKNPANNGFLKISIVGNLP
jgi:hypothetical protein